MLVKDLEDLANKAFSNMAPNQAKGIKNAINEVKLSELKKSALKEGAKIENFKLSNIYEERISLKSLIKNEYLLINFYRGGWCPFCVLELQEYEKLKVKFEENGVDIVAISPEVTKYSLDTKNENSLSFEILCDENSKLMKEFGIVFTLNKEVKELYKSFGIDLLKQNGNDSFEMPVPATYVLDKDLNIIFAHIEEDYTTRFEPLDILEFIQNR